MKYFVGSLLIALMTIVIVLVVRHEAREVRRAVNESVKEAVRESTNQVIERAPETIEKAADRVIGSIVGPSPAPEAPARQADSQSKPDTPPNTNAPPNHDSRPSSESQSGSEPLPTGQPLPRLDPVDMVGKVFETGRRAAKAVDDVGQKMLPLDDAQEREIGREAHAMILRNHPYIDSASTRKRIEELAAPVIALCRRKNVNYTFTVIDDPKVNAFSHVGGYIYVHTGLLKLAQDDPELQFVLAHEIGHIDQGDCTRALVYAARISRWTHAAVGQLARVAYHLIALGYNEDFEFAADEYAFRDLLKIGRSREEALEFPRDFAKYVAATGLENGRQKPATAPEAVVQEIENHFRSHPPAVERLRRLENMRP